MLGEIYAQGLAAAGYNTSTDLNLGDQDVALAALKGGDISAYPEYTGTALTVFFKKDAADLPKDPQEAYTELKADFAKDGITAFPPTPFTSSNEVAVTKETADKYGLKNISDLSKVAKDLTLYGTPRVPQAHGLPARPAAGLRAGVQEVHARLARSAPRGADLRPRRRVDRLHDRPADQAQQRGPARGRQGHVPAL